MHETETSRASFGYSQVSNVACQKKSGVNEPSRRKLTPINYDVGKSHPLAYRVFE